MRAGAVRNAVLFLHGTTGRGANFLTDGFAGTLFGPGQPLDATRCFIILPDSIGHGQSSKPSDGLRAGFPRYIYADMVEAQYRLLNEKLGVNHLRLILGVSMGGMHAWLWGERYPEFMDAILPLVCLPAQISGRNRMQRRLIIDAIRNDPQWNGGNYDKQPQGFVTALRMALIVASSARQLQLEAPTLRVPIACWTATLPNASRRAMPTIFCTPGKRAAVTIRDPVWTAYARQYSPSISRTTRSIRRNWA